MPEIPGPEKVPPPSNGLKTTEEASTQYVAANPENEALGKGNTSTASVEDDVHPLTVTEYSIV